VAVTLVKPQFEVGRYHVGKGGIAGTRKDSRGDRRDKVIYESLGLRPVGLVEAPREKERKNREYFIKWER
jgi:predicted rRNA methylase YqxC with S4 and FtsJ domains